VSSDIVLEQTETDFDDDGNALEVRQRLRFHDATGTGALGTPSTGIAARVYYRGMYYDLADRLIASVNVGTNGGSARRTQNVARLVTGLFQIRPEKKNSHSGYQARDILECAPLSWALTRCRHLLETSWKMMDSGLSARIVTKRVSLGELSLFQRT